MPSFADEQFYWGEDLFSDAAFQGSLGLTVDPQESGALFLHVEPEIPVPADAERPFVSRSAWFLQKNVDGVWKTAFLRNEAMVTASPEFGFDAQNEESTALSIWVMKQELLSEDGLHFRADLCPDPSVFGIPEPGLYRLVLRIHLAKDTGFQENLEELYLAETFFKE